MAKLVYFININRKPCPFINQAKAKRTRKLNRLIRKGLAPSTDKQSLRQAAEQAIQRGIGSCVD